MTQTDRVRYSTKPSGQHHNAADVQTADIAADLGRIPEHLPPGAAIMHVQDLTADQTVHGTRWPTPYHYSAGFRFRKTR